MKNVILTGGTGMVGSLLLAECLKNPSIAHVTSLVRKPSGTTHSKLKEVVIKSFANYSSQKELFLNQDIAYYCLGVYTGTVPREEFRKITVDYTKAFASSLKEQSPNASLCFLSGAGADRTEKSRLMFAKDKGSAENYLLNLNFKNLYIFRPSYIYPVAPRKEPNISYAIMRKLYPLLKLIFPYVKSTDLARAIFVAGVSGASKTTLENLDIKNLIKNLQ